MLTGRYALSRYTAIYLGEPAPRSTMQVNEVFVCPGFSRVGPPNIPRHSWIVYGANPRDVDGKRLFGTPWIPREYGPAQLVRVQRAAQTVVMSELDGLTNPSGWGGSVALEPIHGYSGFAPVHNYLYFDGHAESIVVH
jgi:prepilin-type processing-associated H-X9-DG protein